MPEEFWKIVFESCDKALLYHSRIHALSSFDTDQAKVFVKREDESGFGISGYKKRKYASLLKWIEQTKPEKTIVIGSAFANHVSGITQLLIENGLPFEIWLKEAHSEELKGNRFLLHLLFDANRIKWLNKKDWEEAQAIAFENPLRDGVFYMPEGGNCAASVPGVLTLFHDVLRNEQESGLQFDHIFVDAGTGLTATLMVVLASCLPQVRHLNVVQMAGDGPYFEMALQKAKEWIHPFYAEIDSNEPSYSLHKPLTGKSFGSTNTRIKQAIERIARTEGVLTDPIYSAKLFITAEAIIKEDSLEGNVLIIHSGGGTGLMGFSENWIR